MSKLFQSLAKPITVPVAMCTRSVAQMDEPLKRHIDEYAARGEDICAAVWREYYDTQVRLLPYRWHKLVDECRYISSGEMALATIRWQDLLFFARFLTKCLFLFIVFVMIGRRSIFPSLEPTSVFVEEVVRNWQPNHINQLTKPTGEFITVMKEEKLYEEAPLYR